MEGRVEEEARRREVVVRRAAIADDGYDMIDDLGVLGRIWRV